MTPRGTRKNVFESEVLKQQIVDKEREFARQLDHYRSLLAEKDNNITKQKNEWAEIYGNMK